MTKAILKHTFGFSLNVLKILKSLKFYDLKSSYPLASTNGIRIIEFCKVMDIVIRFSGCVSDDWK